MDAMNKLFNILYILFGNVFLLKVFKNTVHDIYESHIFFSILADKYLHLSVWFCGNAKVMLKCKLRL